MNRYFFDSSAIIEIINNEQFQKMYADDKMVTNHLNLSEVYYYFLKNHNKQTADYWINSLTFEIVAMSMVLSVKGAEFRFGHRDKRFSYADSIGYVSSIENNLIFLTCDKDFSGLKNTEFVK